MSDAHPRLELFVDDHIIVCWAEGRHRDGIDAHGFAAAGHTVAYFGAEKFPTLTETYFADNGLARRVELRVPNSSSLPLGVIGTHRIATMYRRHAEYFARFLPIKILTMPFAMPAVREEAQWHRMRDKDQGLKWLLTSLHESAARLK
jgi:LysR family nod box-dependent transcriptional activator